MIFLNTIQLISFKINYCFIKYNMYNYLQLLRDQSLRYSAYRLGVVVQKNVTPRHTFSLLSPIVHSPTTYPHYMLNKLILT